MVNSWPHFLKNSKPPIFGPFPHLLCFVGVCVCVCVGGTFSQKIWHNNLIRFSSTMPKFRETWWSNPWGITQQTAGWKDGQTLFYRTFLATARGPTSTTAVDWYLKVKDIENHADLTKNYCFTVSIQKNSSIHKLIL